MQSRPAFLKILLLSVAGAIACNLATPTPTPVLNVPCLASGDQTVINASLQSIGFAMLCQGAVFELSSPVAFYADGEQIYTQGYPLDDRRAVLRIVSSTLTTAVLMRDRNNAVLSNVIVDGNRDALGPASGDALVYAGGFASGQIIRGNKIMNTRSWSSLQLIEGSDRQPCTNALVENNEIGPAGTSASMMWADGITLACTNTSVRLNLVKDATDGGIVVFGAPGSIIENNIVLAKNRTLLGGINMVDDIAYGGSFAGTVVQGNIIDASGAVIRIGLGMGPRVWGCYPNTDAGHVVSGGTVTRNILRGAHMQYGYAIDGVRDWNVISNRDEALHSGTPLVDCNGRHATAPSGFLYTTANSQGTFQQEFVNADLDLALWAIVEPTPGP